MHHPVYLAFYLLSAKGNGSIVGDVAQFNMWSYALPPPALQALSLGINGIGAFGVPWYIYSTFPNGNAKLLNDIKAYVPGR